MSAEIVTAGATILGAIIGFMSSYLIIKSNSKIEIKKIKLELLRDKKEKLNRLSEKMFRMVPAGADPKAATFDNFMKQASEFEMYAYLFPEDLLDRVSSAKSKLGTLIMEAKTQSNPQSELTPDTKNELTEVQSEMKATTKQALRETQRIIDQLIK